MRLKTYTIIDELLDDTITERKLKTQRSLLPTDAKLELLLAAQSRMQSQAKELKKISELTEFINTEALQGKIEKQKMH